ncbi:hypothetical protein M422DRAFT_251738 [Sphaerobolus stellatus SS14]|uniref:Aspartic peptidase DDI1-type domain-containing protein n=1 Tax=Sphaerobolus stellatus (strain SS14) TaxID=990650 RepID=A0A0C9W029_SPHS4|nr:hypothetical protein M422DRAFT_251738 [Sphaerobolus stellatus SS14]
MIRPPGIQVSSAAIINNARELDSIEILQSQATNIYDLISFNTVHNAELVAQSDWDRIAHKLDLFRPSVVKHIQYGSELLPRYIITPFNDKTVNIIDLIYNFIYYLPSDIVISSTQVLSDTIDFEEEMRRENIPSSPVPWIEQFWIDGNNFEKEECFADPIGNPFQVNTKQLRLQEIRALAHDRRIRENETLSLYPIDWMHIDLYNSKSSHNAQSEDSLPGLMTVSNSSASYVNNDRSKTRMISSLSIYEDARSMIDKSDDEPNKTLEEQYIRITREEIVLVNDKSYRKQDKIVPEEPTLFSAAIKPSTKQKLKASASGPTETKIEQNNPRPKDPTRHVPKPLIIIVKINDNPARALVDSGSLSDFMLTTLVDQLKIQTTPLAKPQPCEMAASGSRTLIQCNTSVDFSYQDIQEKRTFDVMNLENYDLILGTPFLFQHSVMLGFNPTHIAIGSKESQPI